MEKKKQLPEVTYQWAEKNWTEAVESQKSESEVSESSEQELAEGSQVLEPSSVADDSGSEEMSISDDGSRLLLPKQFFDFVHEVNHLRTTKMVVDTVSDLESSSK